MANDLLFRCVPDIRALETTLSQLNTAREGVIDMMVKAPASSRDHPTALAAAVIGLLIALILFGCLTARIGSHWVRSYTHRQTLVDD